MNCCSYFRGGFLIFFISLPVLAVYDPPYQKDRFGFHNAANATLDSGKKIKKNKMPPLLPALAGSVTGTVVVPGKKRGGAGGGGGSIPLFNLLDSLLGQFDAMTGGDLLPFSRPVYPLPLPQKLLDATGITPMVYSDSDGQPASGLPSRDDPSESEAENSGEEEENESDEDFHNDSASDGDEQDDKDWSEEEAALEAELDDATQMLFQAVRDNEYEIAESALELGANVNAINLGGETPLTIASAYYYQQVHWQIFKLLIKHGANPVPDNVKELPIEILLRKCRRMVDCNLPRAAEMAMLLLKKMGNYAIMERLSSEDRAVFVRMLSHQVILDLIKDHLSEDEIYHRLIDVELKIGIPGQAQPIARTLRLNLAQWIAMTQSHIHLDALAGRMTGQEKKLSELINAPLLLTTQPKWQLFPLNFSVRRSYLELTALLLKHGALLLRADEAGNPQGYRIFTPDPLMTKVLTESAAVNKEVFGTYLREIWEPALVQLDNLHNERELSLVQALETAVGRPSSDALIAKILDYLHRTQGTQDKELRLALKELNRVVHEAVVSRSELGSKSYRRLRYYVLAYGALLSAYERDHPETNWTGISALFVHDAPEQPEFRDESLYGDVNWAISHNHLPLTLFHISRILFRRYWAEQHPQEVAALPEAWGYLPLHIATRQQNHTIVWFLLAIGECPLQAERQIIPLESGGFFSPFSIFNFVVAQTEEKSLYDSLVLHLLSHTVIDEEPFWVGRLMKIALQEQNIGFLQWFYQHFSEVLFPLDESLKLALNNLLELPDEAWEEPGEIDDDDSLPDYRYRYEESSRPCRYKDEVFLHQGN